MRDRSEQILRCACIALAAVALVFLLRAGCRAGALVGVKIPPVPTLETNSVAGTNAVSSPKGTNAPTGKMQTTNSVKTVSGTNMAAGKTTNATNEIHLISTNLIPAKTNLMGTNLIVAETNLALKISPPGGTNNLPVAGTNSAGTNKPAKKPKKNLPPEMAGMGGREPGGFPGRPGMPGKEVKLPPEIQARVDKIVESEMFAPVMHPQPMALLGIAGETIFLQTPGGQTGLLTVTNEPLDGIKLLRIGINRVLVEQDGQKKELMIFDGSGGESLMPKEESKK